MWPKQALSQGFSCHKTRLKTTTLVVIAPKDMGSSKPFLPWAWNLHAAGALEVSEKLHILYTVYTCPGGSKNQPNNTRTSEILKAIVFRFLFLFICGANRPFLPVKWVQESPNQDTTNQAMNEVQKTWEADQHYPTYFSDCFSVSDIFKQNHRQNTPSISESLNASYDYYQLLRN